MGIAALLPWLDQLGQRTRAEWRAAVFATPFANLPGHQWTVCRGDHLSPLALLDSESTATSRALIGLGHEVQAGQRPAFGGDRSDYLLTGPTRLDRVPAQPLQC